MSGCSRERNGVNCVLDLDVIWDEGSIPESQRDPLAVLLEQGISAAIVQAKGPEDAQVCLTLTNDARIRELNRTYREVDRPTDVLSFALQEQVEEEPDIFGFEDSVLGDIIISVERAREQALEYGHSFQREIVYLAVHGTLHLLGFNHETEAEKKAMRQKEEAVMTVLELRRE